MSKDLVAVTPTQKKKALSPKQIEVISLMVAGNSASAAAEKAEVSMNTLNAWLSDGKFNDEYRLGMERQRAIFENQVMRVAQRGNKVINEFLEHPNPNVKLEAAKIAVNAAVRINSRYKELQVQGFIAPVQPLVIFPSDTKLPWASKPPLPELPDVPDVIDAEVVDEAESDEE